MPEGCQELVFLIMKNWILALALFPVVGFCDVRLPSIFSDNLVLQQKSGNPIWGWASPGEKVEVMTSWGENQVAKAESDGSWMVIVFDGTRVV